MVIWKAYFPRYKAAAPALLCNPAVAIAFVDLRQGDAPIINHHRPLEESGPRLPPGQSCANPKILNDPIGCYGAYKTLGLAQDWPGGDRGSAGTHHG